MVKKDSKGTSFRLKQEAVWMLEDLAKRWECSQTAAVERAILQAHESPFSPPELTYNGARLVGDQNHPHEPATTGLRESNWRPPDTRPKNARCVHCGKAFAGPKFSTICPACTDGNHRGDPRECSECWQPA